MIEELLGEMTTRARALDAVSFAELSTDELTRALRSLEELDRRLEAVAAAGAAEHTARAQRAGRSPGSAAAKLGADLGVSGGVARGRADAGRRADTPAGRALAGGRITAAQERAIGEAVDQLPDSAPAGAREDFSRHLTELAESGAGPRTLTATAARELAAADPGRLDRLDERQQRARELRTRRPGLDGLSSVGITCEPRLQALLDAVVAKFGAPGQCIAAPADPTTGQVADPDTLAAADERTAGQRAYDALCHVLSLGLQADPAAARGVAAIVVRLSPEQLDTLDADGGGLVTTDSGTQLTAAQAVSMAGAGTGTGTGSWFVSALRDGREQLRRIDLDRRPTSRLATTLQRLVLFAAHGGCTHPGCERPATACHAHHVTDYSRGGPTTVANLALVCPTHHGWIGHRPDQWRTIPDPHNPGNPRWIPPGTPARAA